MEGFPKLLGAESAAWRGFGDSCPGFVEEMGGMGLGEGIAIGVCAGGVVGDVSVALRGLG
jgi:hypothetical protein